MCEEANLEIFKINNMAIYGIDKCFHAWHIYQNVNFIRDKGFVWNKDIVIYNVLIIQWESRTNLRNICV